MFTVTTHQFNKPYVKFTVDVVTPTKNGKDKHQVDTDMER